MNLFSYQISKYCVTFHHDFAKICIFSKIGSCFSNEDLQYQDIVTNFSKDKEEQNFRYLSNIRI